MASVFISYRHVKPDTILARYLHGILSSLDHDVFLDESDIPIGAFWDREIQGNIAKAEYFIALVSLSYLHSPYVEKELALAALELRAGRIKAILQVNLAFDGNPPDAVRDVVSQIQYLKWKGPEDNEEIGRQLMNRIPPACSPIKGLRAFDFSDRRIFQSLGRTTDLNHCLHLLNTTSTRMMLIHGVSGAGKTSFIKAGLIPAVEAQGIEIRRFSSEHLATEVTQLLKADGRVVNIFDQFEQALVRFHKFEDEHKHFLRVINEWLHGQNSGKAIFCIREDFRTPFDLIFEPLPERWTDFPLLPLRPRVAAEVLKTLLRSVQLPCQFGFVESLCEKLAEGVPEAVSPALLQLVAQHCRHHRVALNQQSWDKIGSTKRPLFELHILDSVLAYLPRRVSRLQAMESLIALTNGPVKATPKSASEIACQQQVEAESVERILDLAALPHARVVIAEQGEDGSQRFQLTHDLFAEAVHTLHRREERAMKLRTGFKIISAKAILSGMFGVLLATFLVGLFAAQRQSQNSSIANIIGPVVAGFLVMFGFALVETGSTRKKNAAHTMTMIIMIYGLAMLGYWATGFAFEMGGTGAVVSVSPITLFGPSIGKTLSIEHGVFIGDKFFGMFGGSGFHLPPRMTDAGVLALFLSQLVLMLTAATIPTGAMAERWKFLSFCFYGIIVGAVVYPFYANWVWGGGWLAALGRNFGLGHGHVDFSGSSVVHLFGGTIAFVGARMLGPRFGKRNSDGTFNSIPAHNIPFVVLGTFILTLGLFGLNVSLSFDQQIGVIATNTLLASAAGAVCAMITTWWFLGRPEVSFICNGMLAGVVSISTACAFVDSWAAVVIGTVAGSFVFLSAWIIEMKNGIDDPVGAIAVHGAGGLWGVLALGLFANGSYGNGWNGVAGNVTGLLYGNASQFVAQLIGALVCVLVTVAFTTVTFWLIGRFSQHRPTISEEMAGLDLSELGIEPPHELDSQTEYRGH